MPDDKDKPAYSRDDLYKMLDIDGAAEEAADVEIASVKHKPSARSVEPTEQALQLDSFGVRQGKELFLHNEEFRRLGLTPVEVADFFGAAFESIPELTEACVSPARRQFIEQLLENPDYRALHMATALDQAASELAAVEFAKQWAALRPKDDPGRPGGKPGPIGSGTPLDEMAAMRAADEACTKAAESVEELLEAERMTTGEHGKKYDPAAMLRNYRRLRGNDTMRRICEMAGRFRRVAQSKQRQKSVHGYDDMIGVELGDDLGRMLPHEMVKLSLPEFEDDVMRRLVEREVMCRDYKSIEKIGKGPIIVTVDESSSMEGSKVETAKALALTMAYIAKRQRRWCGLVAFSGNSGERLIQLAPGKWQEEAVLHWIEQYIGRGSSRDVPIAEMPRYYEWLAAPKGKTDVIFITDAICTIPKTMAKEFLDWKHYAKAKVYSLIIQSSPGDLQELSDEVYEVPALDTDVDGVTRVLSL